MAGVKSAKPIEERGGYPAGEKLVSQLPPPPKGPAPGMKPNGNSTKKK
jgi:hypothetical protein